MGKKLDIKKLQTERSAGFISSDDALKDVTPFEWPDDVLIEHYIKDGRLTEPCDKKRYNYRKMIEMVRKLGRPLTDQEAKKMQGVNKENS